ncbi:MAG: phospholipid carrier-dependent glycosyltransferase [Kiritimatiellaeota bacterium]|nr:phospholipid carrier-dependent glycosyltransferase [Kiritimatiellota bacterium]
MRKRLGFLLLAAAVLVGAVLRFPRLDRRPMHTDEAVQAAKTGVLLETGRYIYDPAEYHGPTLPLLGALGLRMAGVRRLADATETELRMTPVVFGLGLILLAAGFAGLLGVRAALAAAFLLACSPVFVFYSRYYIHETLFVFFTGAFLLAFERYWRSPRMAWAMAVGVSFGLLCATKETWVFEAVALVLAFIGTRLWGRWRREPRTSAPEFLHPGRLGAAALAAGLVAAVLFSDFFVNPRGIADSFRAFPHYTSRSSATLHALAPLVFLLRPPVRQSVPAGADLERRHHPRILARRGLGRLFQQILQ